MSAYARLIPMFGKGSSSGRKGPSFGGWTAGQGRGPRCPLVSPGQVEWGRTPCCFGGLSPWERSSGAGKPSQKPPGGSSLMFSPDVGHVLFPSRAGWGGPDCPLLLRLSLGLSHGVGGWTGMTQEGWQRRSEPATGGSCPSGSGGPHGQAAKP